MIFAKVSKTTDKRVSEYALEDGSRITDLLFAAGIEYNVNTIVMVKGTQVQLSSVLSNNVHCMVSDQARQIKVRVARIGEPLMEVTIPYGQTVGDALVEAGKLPFDTEEIWEHRDGELHGRQVMLEHGVGNGAILVIESKNKLRQKILKIISSLCEDENGEVDEATSSICVMLKRDYNIQ